MILKTIAGSRLYGTHDDDSDFDYVGVRIEAMKELAGFSVFEQQLERTATGSAENPDHAPSGPGDTDTVVYGLRKFLRLASDGNPNALELMFVQPAHCSILTPVGDAMLSLAPLMASKRAGRKYVGYMRGQARKLHVGTLGMTSEKRRALRDTYGYDTKYASHIFRLFYQGVELMKYGVIELPLFKANSIKEIKRGAIPLQDIDAMVNSLIESLELAVGNSDLPEKSDTSTIETWMLDTYASEWAK